MASKYSDRTFNDIFGDLTDPQGGVSESRVAKVHSIRERVGNGSLPRNGAIEEILDKHDADRDEMPVPFSQSASDHAAALTDKEAFDAALEKMPGVKAYAEAKKEEEEGEQIGPLAMAIDVDEAIKNRDSYYEKAKDIVPYHIAHAAREYLSHYMADTDDMIKTRMRNLQKEYPALQAIKVRDDKVAPLGEFIPAMIEIEDELDYHSEMLLSKFKQQHGQLLSLLFTMVYPEKTVIENDRAQKMKRLEAAAKNEFSQSCGFKPEALYDAALHQLTARHNVDKTLLNHHTVGINNGSSSSILVAALGTVPNIKGDIITPEYHWDGYDAIATMADRELKEVPRAQHIGEYISQYYEKKSAFSFTNNKQKCDVADIGAILITHPCSVTGKEYDTGTLRSLLKAVKERHIPLIINEMHAGPSADGKLFDSLTRLPEYKDAAQYVLIIGSITKTCNITENTPKFSYFYTGNKEWAKKISDSIHRSKDRPFTLEDVARVGSYLDAVTPEYWVKTEGASVKKRDQVEAWMAKTNKTVGSEAVKWHLGRPDKGYISAIEFAPELLKKAEINNPMELYEYLYKVAGVSVGEVIPSSLTKQTGAHSVRINYGLTDKELDIGLDLMGHAVDQMQHGVTLSQARETCPNRSGSRDTMLDMLKMFFGGGIEVRVVRGRGD